MCCYNYCTESKDQEPQKKSRRNKRHLGNDEPMFVDQGCQSKICLKVEVAKIYLWFTDSTEDKKEKKKKRKRDEQEGITLAEFPEIPSISESKKERKERKRRRKMEKSATEDALTSLTPAEASYTPPTTSPEPQICSTTSAEITAFLAEHSITINTPPNVPQVTPIINFSQLDIPSDLRSSFDGFKEPTPIQACTWPPALEGRDVVGIAETGRYAFNFTSPARLYLDST